MFEQSLFHKILPDALIRALLLTILADLLLTGYAVDHPALSMILVVITVLAPFFSGWLFSKSEKKNKRILIFALASFILALIFTFILLLLSIVLSIRLFPTHNMSVASPLLFLGVIPYVLLGISLLRIIVFTCLLVRNGARGRGTTEPSPCP